jgi:5-formyltetrahydrofolate cyclo-ligase
MAARRGGPADAGTLLARTVLTERAPPPGVVVAAFWSLPGEIDMQPLIAALHARGPVALPETPPRGQPLRFRLWQPGCPMRQGRFGTVFPDTPVLVPGYILVPLLAFDARCRRLGYGGGYYDRTLAGLPGVPRVGCAFANQRVDHVPTGPSDMPLDAVATESGLFTPES